MTDLVSTYTRRLFLKSLGMGSALCVMGCASNQKAPSGQPVSTGQEKGVPNVLIIGDSISLGYAPYVKTQLQGRVNIVHAPGNNAGTTLGCQKLTEWLGDTQWDLIHFNWGLHDLKHVKADTGQNSNDPNDPQQADIQQYKKNMEQLVKQLKRTRAKLIFATTTPYPAGVKPCRLPEDAQRYNRVACQIMKKNGITVNDLHDYILPRLQELQQPVNVHFSKQGSEVLAAQVVTSIMAGLGMASAADQSAN